MLDTPAPLQDLASIKSPLDTTSSMDMHYPSLSVSHAASAGLQGSALVRIVTSDNLPNPAAPPSDAQPAPAEAPEPVSIHKGLTITTADGFMKDSRSGLWQEKEKDAPAAAEQQEPGAISMAVDVDEPATPGTAAAAEPQ